MLYSISEVIRMKIPNGKEAFPARLIHRPDPFKLDWRWPEVGESGAGDRWRRWEGQLR